MAGLQPLTRLIYCEQQQKGSMLCAQHALNTVLQGNYFTAPDLSAIAAKLDSLEESVNEDRRGRASANMDDTGFFSVQVLEEALQLWGLRMVHWRSSEMQTYQETPDRQFAFVLNLEQHWFTIRRFGIAADLENATAEEAERCHWFNLNSFLDGPEWISKTFLGMILQQAEAEGYSVYAIRRIDPEDGLDIVRSKADEVASTLPQPSGATGLEGQPSTSTFSRTPEEADFEHIEGIEDEDMELQAALQASLGGSEQVTIPTGPSRAHAMPGNWQAESPVGDDDDDDPVASSIARSRNAMNQMLRHQEAALREARDEEVAFTFPSNRFMPLAPPAPERRRTQGEDEEDDALRRALEESRAGASGDVDHEDDDELYVPPPRPPPAPPATERSPLNDITFAHHTGVYDDDDADLQAALRASLEEVPGGANLPPPVHVSRGADRSPPMTAGHVPSRTPTAPTPLRAPVVDSDDEDDDEEMDERENKNVEASKEEEAEPVDVDEMRRRRLARFGG